MRILVFGATGGTGRELVGQALDREHEVTAFVRTPEKLPERHPRLRIVQGDIARPDTIRAAIPGQDALASALGARTLGPSRLLSNALREILSAMTASGVRRIIWESALGVGETRGWLGPIYNWFLIPVFLRHVFADKERQEEILRASPLDWTIVQPGALTDGPRTGRYRVGLDAPAGRLLPRISRADVAHFMIGELEQPRHVHEVVPICY
jgi:putative NADH-flavin reductase